MSTPLIDPQPADPVALLAQWRGVAGLLAENRTEGECQRLEHLDDAGLVDLVAEAERVKAALAAVQVRAAAVLDTRTQVGCRNREQRTAADRSTGGMVALARRESPHAGSKHLGMARALTTEMPCTMAALTAGAISEHAALVLVKETAVLTAEDRTGVDTRLADRMAGLGVGRLGREARAIGYELDRESPLRRVRGAESDRRVCIRPVPGPMTWVGAYLPVKAGVAVFGALKGAAASARSSGDERTEGQLMADTLLARVTGAEHVDQVGVEVAVVMGQAALHDPDSPEHDTPAWVAGFGPVPAAIARTLVRAADRAWIRRLYTDPVTGQLVTMDARRRLFTGALRRLTILRDETCRTPWCDAPVKHVDHVTDHAAGGLTTDTNAQGLCVGCNQRLNLPGWTTTTSRRSADGSGKSGRRGEITLTTPTGHSYPSRPPPLAGHPTHVIHLVNSTVAHLELDWTRAA